MPFMSVQDAGELIRLEYAETPDLQLTFWQMQQLWNLSEELCDRALKTLIASGFLVRTRDGWYQRPRQGTPSRDGDARRTVSAGETVTAD